MAHPTKRHAYHPGVTSVRSRATRGSTHGPESLVIRDLDLRPPALNEGLIEREHLLDRLRRAGHAQVVALIAPAGYGKTTLMTQWIRSASQPAAWLTLDPADNDPVTLLNHLWAAFAHAGMLAPDDGKEPRSSSRPTTDGIPRLVRALQS